MKRLEKNDNIRGWWAFVITMLFLIGKAQAVSLIDEELQGSWSVKSQMKSETVSVSVTELPVVRTISLPGTWPTGLAFDGTWIWHADGDTNRIYRLDPSDGTMLESIASPSNHPTGLDWYEGNLSQWHGLWNCDYSTNRVYHVIDPLHSIPAPGSSPNGVVWIEDALWVNYFGSEQLYKIDPSDGDIIDTIQAPGASIRGMTIWKGDLWVVDSNLDTDAIYRLDPSNGTILATYLPEGFTHDQYICGLTGVGDELWVVDKYSCQALILVPEPATLCLLALGGIALFRRRRS